MAPWLLFSLMGLGFFYLQNLALFPRVHLDLLALLLFYTALRPSLSLALFLAVTLGVLQDSYAATPFGLHLGGAFLLVAAARFSRRRFLMQRWPSQLLASIAALALQEVWLQANLAMLGLTGDFFQEIKAFRGVEILGTAALGPLMAFIVLGLEKLLRRWGWRPEGDSSAQFL